MAYIALFLEKRL